MNRAMTAGLVMVLAVAAPARAQQVIFTYEQTLYDGKGPLKAPEGLACTERGYLVVGDTGNKRLLLFNVREGRVSGGEEIVIPQLTQPVRVQVDSRGNILALDGKLHRVVRIASNGTFEKVVEPTGMPGLSSVVVGAFKVDAKDTVWLLDIAGRRVLMVDASGAFAGEVPLPKDSVAIMDLALDVGGNLYAVDAVAGTIWIADKGGNGFRALATNLKDKMNFPTGITASRGRLFIVDRHGNGVVVFGVDGSYMGRQLSVGWTNGLVNYPGQLCLTDSGAAYLADTLNNRVQVFSTGTK